MAAPLTTAKATVDLATSGVRVSRIRRDPPSKPKKELSLKERDERDRQTVILGIAGFTLLMIAAALITLVIVVLSSPQIEHLIDLVWLKLFEG